MTATVMATTHHIDLVFILQIPCQIFIVSKFTFIFGILISIKPVFSWLVLS